jgi:LmbE family N-acetylglucosaminyl deacetylase
MLITEAAVFYSRLTKWDEQFDHLPVHAVPQFLHFFLGLRTLAAPRPDLLVVDIGGTLEKKMAAIQCYQTQFPPAKAEVLDRIRTYAAAHGMSAGFAAGEVVASANVFGTRDLMGLLFGKDGERPGA